MKYILTANDLTKEYSHSTKALNRFSIHIPKGAIYGFIGENGAVAIFTREDGTGWSCRPGTKITWTFEKYGNQKHINQTIAIGYIKDGIMYTPEIYQEELAGKYQVEFEDIGNIYIYIMCMAADPIAVKEGIIEIQEKGDT